MLIRTRAIGSRGAEGIAWAVLCAFAAGWPQGGVAATPLVSVRVSPDVTVEIGAVVVDDEGVASDNLTGSVTPVGIGAIPGFADLDAYALAPNGAHLLSFDTTVTLPGGLTARPGDVVRLDGTAYSLAFEAAAARVPSGANVDAVTLVAGMLALSFDVTVDLGGVVADDEDLVLFDGSGFTLFFDGSASGVSAGLDLDAAHYIDCNGHLLVSFDGSGAIGALTFDDEDVLEYDGVASWEMAYDGSAAHVAWSAADLDALHATVDLGPGPPVVFGQTIRARADKTGFVWPVPTDFRVVRGPFATPGAIGSYTVNAVGSGSGTLTLDASIPASSNGYWYLVKPGGCRQTSWQTTLGAEPGRDASIP